MEIDVLHVLDQMDAIRRKHYYDCPPPADCYFRILEAVLANAAGFDSRQEWTEKLKADPATQYHFDYHNSKHKGEF